MPDKTPEVSVEPTRETAPERIFLQPECCVDPYGEGRQWCEDDVWEECGEPGCECKAVRYVREDLASQTPPATQPSATVGEAIDRIRVAVERREAGVQADALHRKRSGCSMDDETLAKDRSHATVAGLRLDDLQAILATLHTPPPVATATVVDAGRLTDIIKLIDEVNELGESRRFYGIGQVLHGKLCTIRFELLLASRATSTPPAGER